MRSPCRAAGARSSISLCHKGAKPIWNDKLHAFVPPDGDAALSRRRVRRNGAMLLSECLARRRRKSGSEQAERSGLHGARPSPFLTCTRRSLSHHAALVGEGERHGKAFVDYQNDVTAKDLPLAAHEGYDDRSSSPSAIRRPAWRPTRASSAMSTPSPSSPRRRARRMDRGRHHDLPALLHAGLLRRFRRALHRPSFPAGAQDAAA